MTLSCNSTSTSRSSFHPSQLLGYVPFILTMSSSSEYGCVVSALTPPSSCHFHQSRQIVFRNYRYWHSSSREGKASNITSERKGSALFLAKRKGSSSGRKKLTRKKREGVPPLTVAEELLIPSAATQRPPATLAGIVENHNYEQFFYDCQTANQLYQLVDLYERPLLLCNPTLAAMAEKKSKTYKLLDRDTRFNFLDGYEKFSLMEPHLITGYDFDAVFIDPPFANVSPKDVARCLRLISAHDVPLWVAYNSRREEELLKALNALDSPNLEPKWRLSYKEGVSEHTQGSIWLYGPENLN